jgi:hypothetical protein
LDTTTPRLASIGIDIGKEVFHILGFSADGTELAMMRWGMPPPLRTGGWPVTALARMAIRVGQW